MSTNGAAPHARPVLEIAGLGVSYGAVRAAEAIDLTIAPGACISLVGANGAGKTSILHGISGLVPTRPGTTVLLDGEDLIGLDACRRARAGLGHVLEGRHIFPELSVRENLALGAAGRRRDAAKQIESVLELLPELRPALARPGGTLSGGQQQMLAIGRALAGDPKVLLMDEPTNGLASILVTRVVEIIRMITARGIAVLLVEQRLEVARAAGERIYILQRGRLIDEVDGDDGRLAEMVHAAYLS